MQCAISIYNLVNNIFSKKENQISQFGLIYFSSTILKMDLFLGGKGGRGQIFTLILQLKYNLFIFFLFKVRDFLSLQYLYLNFSAIWAVFNHVNQLDWITMQFNGSLYGVLINCSLVWDSFLVWNGIEWNVTAMWFSPSIKPTWYVSGGSGVNRSQRNTSRQ